MTTTLPPYEPTHLKRWKMPDSYFGEVWPDYFVFLGRHRDSTALSESNFAQAMERLASLPEYDDEYSRQSISESHWAVGWVEWIAIHADDYEALKAADEMAASLDNYPVLDEDDLSRREEEEARIIWQDCYGRKERLAYYRRYKSQFEFTSWLDLLGCLRGQYFGGYASELIAR